MEKKDFSRLNQDLQNKVESLIEYFSNKIVIVTYSGGVDSPVIAELANRYARHAIAVTVDSPTVPPGEIEEAIELARSRNWEHRVINISEIEEKNFRRNPPNRCYYYKKFLSKELHEVADEIGADIIVEGTNFTEIKGHRPD